MIITSDHDMADVNNSRLIQLDYYIPSDWYTLITDPNMADHASNVFFSYSTQERKVERHLPKAQDCSTSIYIP